MSRHLLFIDPLEKLNIKKDSSLMLALTLQKRGEEVYVFFEEDFGVSNTPGDRLDVHFFNGEFRLESYYLKSFELGEKTSLNLTPGDLIHMRLDPPFDSRYLRYLWMLRHLQSKGVRILNDPKGVLLFNEKLYAYEQKSALPSYVGKSLAGLENYLQDVPEEKTFILKPLDLFQGMGVEKVAREELAAHFAKKAHELQGPVVVQPFLQQISRGEVRSTYFRGQEIGSILKVPPKGEFLANIAQGAKYSAYELKDDEREECEKVCHELAAYGVDLVSFDILDGHISEVNVTCPGLLVEVSEAVGKNLCENILDAL